MNKIISRAYHIREIALDMAESNILVENRIMEIQLHSGYAEPGYSSKTEIVATGNWNDINRPFPHHREVLSRLPSRIGALFERMGIECEWSDEWAPCHDCNRLLRTQGDSYSWKPSYIILNDCEFLCKKCADEH